MKQKYIEENGNVVNTDNARKLFADVGYNGSNSAAVHEVSSKISNDVFKHLLESRPQTDVYFMAGGSGAGKSTATRGALEALIQDAALNLDGNLSRYETARSKIDLALEMGKEPNVVYVYRDPVEAWNNGVIKRMVGSKTDKGRVVPLKEFLKNTEGSLETVKKLQHDGDVDMQYFINDDAKHETRRFFANDLQEIHIAKDLQRVLVRETEEMARSKTITREQYRALLSDLPHTEWESLFTK